MELVSQSEYARMRGLWRSTVTRQIASGVIPVHGDRRMVNPEEADRCREEILHPFKGARRGLRAAENADSTRVNLTDYQQGAAFITNAFRHPARIESFAEVCVSLGCSAAQAYVIAKVYSYLLGAWLQNWVNDCGWNVLVVQKFEQEPDWAAIAELAGQPLNLPDWEQRFREAVGEEEIK